MLSFLLPKTAMIVYNTVVLGPGQSCPFENAYLYYPGLEAISIGGVPGPNGNYN
jgi:hypothetical protein